MIFNVLDINKESFPVKVIAIDHANDLCILRVQGIKKPAIKIASEAPEPGDRVYNLAAPTGIFDKNMIPIFEGFFNGSSKNRTIYSIPAKGGSSGSPIFNSNSELIGMIHSVNVYFPVISVSPPKDMLIKFVENSIAMGEEMRAAKLKGKSE